MSALCQARLKYLVSEWGIDRFRTVTEQYLGKKFQPSKPLPPWEFKDYLGWMEQGDGNLAYGIYVHNGRIKGDGKKTLRRLVEKYDLPVYITANQNLILRNVQPEWKEEIAAELSVRGRQSRWGGRVLCPRLRLSPVHRQVRTPRGSLTAGAARSTHACRLRV